MESLRIREIEVHLWRGARPDAPVVVAAHGITSNGLVWSRVADRLAGEVTLVAPDLRGRAGSREAPAPFGIGRHAADLIAVLDALEIERALFVGHSMGAVVAAVAANREPTRAKGIVLVDGGPPATEPPPSDLDQFLAALLGPAIARLSMTFATRAEYSAYWRKHPAFHALWAPWVEEYVQHDLVGPAPYRSSCNIDAVRVDSEATFRDVEVRMAFSQLALPGVLLLAERGILNGPKGLFSDSNLAATRLSVERITDTNHYSIVIGERGAETVADHIRAACLFAG